MEEMALAGFGKFGHARILIPRSGQAGSCVPGQILCYSCGRAPITGRACGGHAARGWCQGAEEKQLSQKASGSVILY
eukprot:1344670-Lingulodinium_polyedra.AAC.1